MENTKSEASGKMIMPVLIKVPIAISKKQVNENLGEKAEWVIIEARICPAYVGSYYPCKRGEEGIPGTSVYVYGQNYLVDMPIEEFDKIMENTDRSYGLNIIGHKK